MPSPIISICIPAYRAEKYLEETLSSVAAQKFTDWEIVVTEDGSKDEAENIVLRFARTVTQSVRYERHTENRGLAATRNSGIAAARGEWVAFLDADDQWLPDHLASLITHSKTADMVFSGTIPFDDSTGKRQAPIAPQPADLADLPGALYSGRLSILPSSAMVRRELFQTVGPVSVSYPCVNDTEYWLRLLRAGRRAAYSGADTLLYRKHDASMSRNLVNMLLDSARLCEAYADWASLPRFLRHRRPAELYRWAAATISGENPARALKILQCSLKNELLNAKTLGLLGKVLLQRLTHSSPVASPSYPSVTQN